MKKIIMLLTLVLSLVLMTSSVMAYTYLGSFVKNGNNYNWSNSRYYTGDAFTLDNGGSILTGPTCDNIDEYLRVEDFPFVNSMVVGGSYITIPITPTPYNTDGDNYVWFTLNPDLIPDYYLVKGGSCDLGNNVLQLYGVNPSDPDDTTSFYDFFNTCRGDYDLSHISFYQENCSVPIPPSMLLLFSGMIGLIGIRRHKLSKS